jgi:hypothetical protein
VSPGLFPLNSTEKAFGGSCFTFSFEVTRLLRLVQILIVMASVLLARQ